VLLGAGLRLFKLGSNSLWFDETVSVSMTKVMRDIPCIPQPPLYIFLLYHWSRVAGENEFALRFLSLVFGVLSIPAIYVLGKLLFDSRTGLASAFLLAISPLHVWYAQEVREYSLLPFLVMACAYFFARALNENKRRLWAGFAVTAVLSLYTNYFAFLIIASTGAFFLFKPYRPLAKRWLISCLAVSVLYAPWLIAFVKHLAWIQGSFWIPRPTVESIRLTLENFSLGYNAAPLGYFFGLLIFALLFLIGSLRGKENKRGLMVSLFFLFIPLLGSWLISQRVSVYLDRQNMAVSPFYYIVAAHGLAALRKKRWLTILLGTGVIALSALSLYNYYKNYMPEGYLNKHSVGVSPKKDFRKITGYLKENLREGDALVFAHPGVEVPFQYYFNYRYPVPAYYLIDRAEEDVYFEKVIRLYESENRPDGRIRVSITDVAGGFGRPEVRRLWLIASSWLRTGELEDNSLAIRNWMEAHHRKIDTKEFDGILVELYEN
ncbi:MAG: glycosyltransferase family 39 protein, partial [Candidatus Omnitrophica bacterium]|nr:glycosyltransferase family 39 protein [Candidatus Omnitrophota bacterium]